MTSSNMDNRTNQGGYSLAGKKFKDFSRTFNELFQTHSCDVLPRYGVFNEGNFREHFMFLASYKNC